ncbi:bacteriocin [Campylobacter jejuni]|uniref:Bacteriocin n=2 Tax=Campylobacter jejuni TaxID=197 RepID=A0A431BUW4_CAMJU|nr:bacteriocin [Campylobacter jejuni]ECL3019462.1 bacteriocin [Campylobacter jejuni]EDP6004738.1 bacteriocin [Campylobacter jejuni]RTJ27317.1 bacteriocin [Campylobacter jejuni]RTJ44979.1 bacteriocin [Campylobacter jejuni]RTJ79457.1 bacteriocin [Campylobacter jejuni]
MLKKLASSLILGSLLASSAFAGDFLAKVSNGALSDNSQGVKALNLDEMKQVKGGYVVSLQAGSQWGVANEYYAVALYSSEEFLQGLCPLGQTTCSNHSMTMLTAFNQVVNQKYGEYGFFPIYKVKREVKVSDLGNPYVLFSYGTGALDSKGQLYRFDSTTSSSHLNYNALIKDIAKHYKEQMESALGGWSPYRARR